MIWFIEKKNCGIITEVLYFHATWFLLRFLLRTFFKTVGEPLHLFKVHPKLIFRGGLKKALMVPENRSYQTQYFAKIFPSPLALMLLSNVQPLVHPKLRILCYFSKTWLNIWRKSCWSSLFWWNRSVLQIFLFSAYYIFRYWGKLPSHAWLEKNCVYEVPPLFFSLKHFRLFVFVKNYH